MTAVRFGYTPTHPGEVLKDEIEYRGISQRQLAERMGCSPQYVSPLLKGEENLSLETICKLENALNLSIMQTVLD